MWVTVPYVVVWICCPLMNLLSPKSATCAPGKAEGSSSWAGISECVPAVNHTCNEGRSSVATPQASPACCPHYVLQSYA